MFKKPGSGHLTKLGEFKETYLALLLLSKFDLHVYRVVAQYKVITIEKFSIFLNVAHLAFPGRRRIDNI